MELSIWIDDTAIIWLIIHSILLFWEMALGFTWPKRKAILWCMTHQSNWTGCAGIRKSKYLISQSERYTNKPIHNIHNIQQRLYLRINRSIRNQSMKLPCGYGVVILDRIESSVAKTSIRHRAASPAISTNTTQLWKRAYRFKPSWVLERTCINITIHRLRES